MEETCFSDAGTGFFMRSVLRKPLFSFVNAL